MENKKSQIKTMNRVQAFISDRRSQIKTINRVQALIFNRRSQIKMMETISVLIIFLIILTFVIIFYVNISNSTEGTRRDDLSNLKAVEISQLVSFMPEFQCSFKNIIHENCFDILRMEAFMNYTLLDVDGQKSLGTTYYDLFGYSKVTVKEIYPVQGTKWVVYERQPAKDVFESRMTFIPISLYDADQNSYYLGMLNVTVYS